MISLWQILINNTRIKKDNLYTKKEKNFHTKEEKNFHTKEEKNFRIKKEKSHMSQMVTFQDTSPNLNLPLNTEDNQWTVI